MRKVLDACCGGRMFWFDKSDRRALFVDRRTVPPKKLSNGQTFRVNPDVVADFRHLPFDNDSFDHIVFDPPHLKSAGDESYMALKYGKLPKSWQDYLKDAIDELWRVLAPGGTLIFKWNECQIKTGDVITAIGRSPLYGHTTNNKGTTIWMAFYKERE